MPPFGKRGRKVRQEYHGRGRNVKIVDAAKPLCYTPGVPAPTRLTSEGRNTRLRLFASPEGVRREATVQICACSSVGEHHPDTVGVVGSIPTTHTISTPIYSAKHIAFLPELSLSSV